MDIIKIDKVNDYSCKSFNQYTGPTSLFGKSNIFFASNGQGKSSFALGIEAEYLKSYDSSNYRIYNKDYIENHLLLEDRSGIKGVVANFGGRNVDIEKKVKPLVQERDTFKSEIDKLGIDNSKLVSSTETAIEDIFKRRKGKANIQKKTHKDGVHEKVVSLWVAEYNAALKLFPDEKYNEIDGEKDFSENLDIINTITVPSITTPIDYEIDQSELIIGKKYNEVNIPSGDVVSWLEVGLGIHQGKDTCEFCLGTLDATEIHERINSYLKNEQSVDRRKLETLSNQIAQLIVYVQAAINDRKMLIAALDDNENIVSVLDELAKQTDTLETYLSIVKNKIDDMPSAFTIDGPAIRQAVAVCKASFVAIQKAKDNQKQLFEEKINRLEILVKGSIGYEIKNSTLIADNCSQYKNNNDTIRELESKVKAKNAEIQRLRDSKSDLADFADYVNGVLGDVGIGFRLALNDKSYLLKHSINGSELSLDDISEGERNLLSLVYFYYEMLSDDKSNLKNNIELVIVDDPTSSMDDENRFYILELIKSIISSPNIQSFVFTHSWRDYCDLCYGKDANQGVKKFEIRKVDGVSTVEVSNSVMMPYRKLFKEVYDFSQKQLADVSSEESLHMPNAMRRVLEEYLRFKIGIEFATQAKYNEIARVLLGQEVVNISANNEVKIKTLLSVCNILSHGTPHSRNTSEIHASARFLMRRLEDIDNYHYDKMRS